MKQLHPSLRNDVLRVSLCDLAPAQSSVTEEFRQLLSASPAAKTVIVELPNVDHLDGDTMRAVLGFQTAAQASGRRFHINGLSHLVSEVLARLGQPARSGPHLPRSAPHAGFVAAS